MGGEELLETSTEGNLSRGDEEGRRRGGFKGRRDDEKKMVRLFTASKRRLSEKLTSFASLVEDEGAERLVEVQQIIERQQDGHNLWRHFFERIL